MMNKEIKYLLEEIKDNTYDYVGTNGCLYQDLSREELNLLLEYINNLEQQCKKQKEIIDKAIEYMKDFIFEPLLTNEDRKLIMYNDNLRNFEKILKEVE